jgi:hypothetical protein
MLTQAAIQNRTKNHTPTWQQQRCHDVIRDIFASALAVVQEVVPTGRELALTQTNLEEAMMWAKAGIDRNPDKVLFA